MWNWAGWTRRGVLMVMLNCYWTTPRTRWAASWTTRAAGRPTSSRSRGASRPKTLKSASSSPTPPRARACLTTTARHRHRTFPFSIVHSTRLTRSIRLASRSTRAHRAPRAPPPRDRRTRGAAESNRIARRPVESRARERTNAPRREISTGLAPFMPPRALCAATNAADIVACWTVTRRRPTRRRVPVSTRGLDE